jgi:hypothetical protein
MSGVRPFREPTLESPERNGQGKRIGIDCWPSDITYDLNDTDGLGIAVDRIGLLFDGDG